MRSGSERPVHFDVAGEVLVGDLRSATHRRFPVVLARNEVKLYVMGQLLENDLQPLFSIRGIYDGATVNFMPGKRLAESKEPSRCATQCKQKLRISGKYNHNDLHLSDLEDLDTDDEELVEADANVSPRSNGKKSFSRQVSPDSTTASNHSGDETVTRQVSKGSRNSQPARTLSKGSAKNVSPDAQMASEKKQASKGRKKSKETMPRVSQRCPLLLDNWTPDPEWATPSNKEKAKVPKSMVCQLLGA